MKKPFKETKVGKFLASKGFNNTLEFAESLGLPGVGALDKIKDVVLGNNETVLDRPLSQEEVDGFLKAHQADMEEMDKRLADVTGARTMYGGKHEMADIIAKRVMNWNLPAVTILVAALILCTVYLKDNILLALISSSIGAVTGKLLDERLTIMNFFFGSSLGSKDKSAIINGK